MLRQGHPGTTCSRLTLRRSSTIAGWRRPARSRAISSLAYSTTQPQTSCLRTRDSSLYFGESSAASPVNVMRFGMDLSRLPQEQTAE